MNQSLLNYSQNQITINDLPTLNLRYPNFKQIVHLPNGKNVETVDSNEVIVDYIKTKTDDLNYTIFIKKEEINNVVNIIVFPITESA